MSFSSDNGTAVSGSRSARIANTGAPDTGLGVTSVLLPLEQVRGRHLRVSGSIRTENVNPGYAAIWLRVDGQSGFITLDNMSQTGPRGTTGWTRYEYEREVNAEATQVIFGVFLSGRGTAWFDNLEVLVDGQPLVQGAEPFIGEPTAPQLDWLRRNAVEFRSPDAETGFADLMPLKPIIGEARVVGLGEATHGTSEFFRMKHRLVEFLAAEMGFSIFSIEANMPESYWVNDYVLAGRGDPKQLLRGMYFWTWNTQEVLDMIEWMRRFNASGRGRIQFTGFDMQTYTVAAQIVRAFVEKSDPEFLSTVDDAYRSVCEASLLASTPQNMGTHLAAAWAARTVRERLSADFQRLAARFPMAEVDWALQNARVVEQAAFVRIGGGLHRDEMMALNTRWILDSNPGARMAIWAHNYHVSRVPGAQGAHLARWFGNQYTVLGFAFHEGVYNPLRLQPSGAFGPLGENTAALSFPGSVQYMFQATGLPGFVLDLRRASPDNDGAWLLGEMEFRELGAVAGDGFSLRRTLVKDYDALIFFSKTTSSKLLPF